MAGRREKKNYFHLFEEAGIFFNYVIPARVAFVSVVCQKFWVKKVPVFF